MKLVFIGHGEDGSAAKVALGLVVLSARKASPSKGLWLSRDMDVSAGPAHPWPGWSKRWPPGQAHQWLECCAASAIRKQQGGSQPLPTQLHNARCLQCLHQPSSSLIAHCFPAPRTGHHLPPDGWPDRSASSPTLPFLPHGHSPLSGCFVLSQGHGSERRRAARTCSLALHQAALPPTQDQPLPSAFSSSPPR